MPAPAPLHQFIKQNIGNANFVINNLTQATGSPLSPRDNFFNVLSQWESAITLQSMWMVFFRIPPMVSDSMMKHYGEFIIPTEWGVDRARGLLSKDMFMSTVGCAFCQAVTIPPEQGSVEHHGGAGEGSRGFLPGPVHKGRSSYGPLNLEFLETNISFVDFLIRPWSILGFHRGLIAPPGPAESITTDMMLVNLGRAGVEYPENWTVDPNTDSTRQPPNQRGFIPRKIWLFEKCVPINVSSETYGTDADSGPGRKDTEWSFKKYQVILPAIMDGAMPQIHEQNTFTAKGNESNLVSKPAIKKQETLREKGQRQVREMHARGGITMNKDMEQIYKERGGNWVD